MTRSEPPGPDDRDLAGEYPAWADKGPDCGGVRLTLMADRTSVPIGAEIRVVHVSEALDGRDMYVMGPKPVRGERLDEAAVTADPEDFDRPLVPLDYDGRVVAGPGVDANWMVTVYRFERPGRHVVSWRPGRLGSNDLEIVVG